MKIFYENILKVDEAIQKFDSRVEFESWLLKYGEEAYRRIKEGDTEWLRYAEEDLGNLITDMNSNFVIADPLETDYKAVQHIIDAIQSRLYT